MESAYRGLGVGTDPTDAAALAADGWRPDTGAAPLPVLTLSESAFDRNAAAMMDYVRKAGVAIAPHAKTPMAPDLSRRLIDLGAWGLSVASVQQAAVLLAHGIPRLLVANQIGGRASARHFAALLRWWPDAELTFFVDSPDSLAAVARVAELADRRVSVLIEVGLGRAGLRRLADVRPLAQAATGPGLMLAGVATYEGAVATGDPVATRRAITALNALAAEAFRVVRAVVPDRPLILSAGGSAFFDLEVEDLMPVVEKDGNATLLLRSGAIFFHDHGVYARGLAALDARGGFEAVTGRKALDAFTPALTVWAEVLSRPEPDLAICGMGMRDVSSDQGLPVPLAVYRDGAALRENAPVGTVVKLNDQHAFLKLSETRDLRVGDIIAFGISHPCTCLDRWRLIFGQDDQGNLAAVYPTHFG